MKCGFSMMADGVSASFISLFLLSTQLLSTQLTFSRDSARQKRL
jgi:hypothetical protein